MVRIEQFCGPGFSVLLQVKMSHSISLMKAMLFGVSSVACVLSAVVIAPPHAHAESCRHIAQQGENAYNSFQAAEARGNEVEMTYHYLNFQLQVKKFQEKGC